jgi:hypothetical protein
MISVVFRSLTCPPVAGNSGNGVAVGGMDVSAGGTGVSVFGTGVAVGGTDVPVGGTGVLVGGTDVSVGGTDVSVGGADVPVGVGVGVEPADAGATCQTMVPMTSRIKTPTMPLEISLGTTDNLL